MVFFHTFNRVGVDAGHDLLAVDSVPTGWEYAKSVCLEVVGNTGNDNSVLTDFFREELSCYFVCVVQAYADSTVGKYRAQLGADTHSALTFDLRYVLQDNGKTAVGTTDDGRQTAGQVDV